MTFQFKIQKKKFPAQTNSYFIEYETRILPRIKLRISKADLNLFAAEFHIRKIKSLYHRQAGILNQPSDPLENSEVTQILSLTSSALSLLMRQRSDVCWLVCWMSWLHSITNSTILTVRLSPGGSLPLQSCANISICLHNNEDLLSCHWSCPGYQT